MAKKKKSKESSISEALGFKNMMLSERLSFMSGAILFCIAAYMIVSFISFFSTSSADISMIESPKVGEIMNTSRQFTNICGSIGAYISYFFIKRCFGIPAFLIPVFLLLLSTQIMRAYKFNLLKWFMCLMLIMIWSSLVLAEYLTPFFGDFCYNPGGDHGLSVCNTISNLIGTPGLSAILGLTAIGFLTYVSAETVYIIRKLLNPSHFFDKVKFKIVDTSKRDEFIDTVEDPTVFDDPQEQTVEFVGDDVIVTTEPDYPEVPQKETEPEMPIHTTGEKDDDEDDVDMAVETGEDEESAEGETVGEDVSNLEPYDPKRDLENYHYPTLDLLKKYENDGKPYIDMEEQTANKNRIVQVLRNFGVEISSIKATVEDDIALSLAALGIRIIAPIPGKGTVGIEVPNAKPNIVSMESILNSKKFQESTMELPCAIGKTITNEVFMFDLAKAPHLLVAGATGQGKSVGLNAIITSLLYKKHPAELKIVLVDPKKVEFSFYEPLAHHFLAQVPDEDADPIITDVTKVVRTLNSLCKEMDTRYDLLKTAHAHNIKEYNKKFVERHLNPEKGHRYLPYIVVVIDEFGDLIMTAGKEVELPIARIAQLARAVGIHMIIATQRPTTNIITGTIKANFPGRIAFRVGAMIDSRTIIDRPGAQQLVGRGDLLYLNGGEPTRVQCAFVDTPEIECINKYISQQQGYPSIFELPEPDLPDSELGGESADVDMQHLDPMFEDAARLIVMSQSGSTSLIQRKFAIGYNRAGRLMDQLEKAGIVGAAHGSKPREVLVQDEVSLDNLLSSLK